MSQSVSVSCCVQLCQTDKVTPAALLQQAAAVHGEQNTPIGTSSQLSLPRTFPPILSIRTAPPNAAHVSDHVPLPGLRCSGCGRSCPGELVPLGVPGVCWNATARRSQGTHHMAIFKPSAKQSSSRQSIKLNPCLGWLTNGLVFPCSAGLFFLLSCRSSTASEWAWQRRRVFGKSQEWSGCFGGEVCSGSRLSRKRTVQFPVPPPSGCHRPQTNEQLIWACNWMAPCMIF